MPQQKNKIFCPKCGSTNTQLLKRDYYTCNSCGTEFFIDEVGVNITQNITYNYDKSTQPAVKSKVGIIFLIFGVLLIIFITTGLPAFFKKSKTSQPENITEVASNLDFRTDVDFFVNNAAEPMMVISAEKKDAERAEGEVIAFVNMLTNKVVKVIDVKLPKVQYDHDVDIEQFSNGNIFIIYDKLKIYKVNISSYSVDDVTASLFTRQSLLSSGVAKAEFMYENYGDGFKVKSNEGKELFYYPGVDSTYDQKKQYAAISNEEQVRPTDQLITVFGFLSDRDQGHDHDELKSLFKYNLKKSTGGPEGDQERNPQNFTQGRTYFEPKVLCYDDQVILILFSNTPADNSPRSIQCLDATTGAIKWTTPLEASYIYKALRYKNGFMISSNSSALNFDNAGKLINEFKF